MTALGGTGGFRQESSDATEIQKKNESCFVFQAQSNSVAYPIPTAAKLQLYKAALLPSSNLCHLTGTFVEKVTGRNWSAFKKNGLGRYSMTNNLVMENC